MLILSPCAHLGMNGAAVPVRLGDGYFCIIMWPHNAPSLPATDDSALSVCSQPE